jgi:hypothetical protein
MANIRSTVTNTGGEEILRRLEHFGQRAMNIAADAVKACAEIVSRILGRTKTPQGEPEIWLTVLGLVK